MRYLILLIMGCIITKIPCFTVQARQPGSETAVTLESQAIFPSVDSDNKMLAFGWFKNGFILEDSNTSCTFESVFPVSGEITLNGGSLYLNSDLHLANITTLTALGKVYGNKHIITIDSSVDRFINSEQDVEFKDIELFLNSDLQISTTVIFNGDCYVNGKNCQIILDSDIEIIVGKNSTLNIKNLTLQGIEGYKIRCFDESGQIILNDISILLDNHYNFTVGSLEIQNCVDLAGSYTFFFDSTKSMTINTFSKLNITDGITLAIGTKNPSTSNKAVWFEDSTSQISFLNGNSKIGPNGISLTRGAFLLDGKVNINTQETTIDKGLILGDGTPEGDILVRFYPAARINFNNSPLLYNLTDPHKFDSMSSFSKLIRGPTSIFYLKKNAIFSDITIKVEPTSAILVDPNVEVEYENCRFILPTVKFAITGSRFNTYTSLLNGNEEIFLQEGILPLYTLVKNDGNYIRGNGWISGGITLYDENAQLIFDLDGQIQNDVILNNSQIVLLRDLEFAHDKLIQGQGVVNLQNNTIIFGLKDLSWTSTVYWDGNDGELEINGNIYLSSSWTFSGNCTINGNSNFIFISPTGQINVERGSSLKLKNVKLYGLQGTNIQCLDDASKIIFDISCCSLVENYNFEKGTFEIKNSCEIKGEKTFAYKSNQTSIIRQCAELIFFPKTIFSYDPSSNTKDLISFASNGSKIIFNDATLHCTTTGLQLTKGNLEFQGKCYISSDEINHTGEGITFGNEDANDDISLIITNASKLEILSGVIHYKNVNESSWNMESYTSEINFYPDCRIYLYQNLDLGLGKMNFYRGGEILIKEGKNLIGSVNSQGALRYSFFN